MAQNPDTKHGKEFENDLHEEFRNQYMRRPVRWTRIMDSGGAGNLIRKAAGDFSLMVDSKEKDSCRPFFFQIECKATVQDLKFESRYRDFIKSEQNASMVMSMRAGAQGIYLFRYVNLGYFEVWDAELVARFYPFKRTRIEGKPAMTVSDCNIPAFAESICTDPCPLLEELRRTRA